MSDDWSLKGKGWIDIPDLDMTPDEYNKWKIGEAQSLATTNVNLKSDDDVKVYPKEVIETLRQKLLEDVTAMREDLFTGRNWKTVVLSIINKRFGVD